ncbi:MAG: hypothetical protein ACE149_10115 [Armatimonadota bacterium]
MDSACRDKDRGALEREIAYYRSVLRELLATAEGKFALIEGERLVGTFETFEDAYRSGVRSFGDKPFLVRQIRKKEPTFECPALRVETVRGAR